MCHDARPQYKASKGDLPFELTPIPVREDVVCPAGQLVTM